MHNGLPDSPETTRDRMRLDAPLIRLPYRFDAETVRQALESLETEVTPTGDGASIVLIGPAGRSGDFGRSGVMRPTDSLKQAPQLAELLAAPGVVLGRTRLLRLAPGGATPHRHDLDRYWEDRARLAFALEDTTLRSGDRELLAPAGSVWLIDGWRGWQLTAPEDRESAVVLADSVGSAAFWSLVASADRPEAGDEAEGMSPRSIRIAGDSAAIERLETERVQPPAILPAAEMDQYARVVLEEMRESGNGPERALERLASALASFRRQWQAAVAQHGDGDEGRAACRQALEQVWSQVVQFAHPWRLVNGEFALRRFHDLLFADALHGEDGAPVEVVPRAQLDQLLSGAAGGAKTAPQAREAASAAGGEQGEPARGGETRAPQPTAQAPAPARSEARAQPEPQPPGQPALQKKQPPPDPNAPLRSVHTRSFPELLKQLGASLLVTTYQAGKLAVLRENEGKINTHFRVYNRPMGLAADRGRLAVGTAWTVEEYRNMSDVARKLDPPGRHDAAYLPRHVNITGNIDIHEMGYGDEGLWLVNTRFSCLCTLDNEHSFVPRWRPGFISGYAPEDRCHLNGLEIVDGKPKYVTALGSTDTAGGWRDNKAGGGIVMDVESGEIICRGLSMPHSPRLYDGKLWVLESGNGSLATIDPGSGRVDTVVELPGFTRGLDFYGPFAFIGLSQVRESAVFSGIRLTERVDERNCGVWVVDLRSAKVVAFLKFEDAVQEVFAVSILPGQRFPDVLGVNDPQIPISYALPDEALRDVVRPQAAS